MVEGNTRGEQSRGGAYDRVHGRVNIGIRRQYKRDDLRFVFVTFGKQRTDWPINHPAIQNFAFGGFALALEKSTGDFSGCIKVFTVIYRQREEIQAFSRLLRGARGDQHYGVSVAHQRRSVSL